MSLLQSLLGGNQAQMPGAMQQPSGLSRLLQPEVALPMAAALLGNQGNMANLGNAFGMAGQGLQAQKAQMAEQAQQNKTYEFFKQNAPEFAQLIDGGAPAGEVWKLYTQQRFAQPKSNEYQERSAAAEQYGLTGDDATSFVLTGALPTGRFGAAEVGLQPIPVINEATGEVELYQPTKSGKPVQMEFPEGYRPMAPFERGFDTAAGRTAGEATGAAQGALPGAMMTAQRVAQQVEELKNHSSLASVLGPMDSRTPNLLPGSVDAQSRIDQLRGGAFLEARQALKGGGAITDFESQRAEQAYARLNQASGEAEFKDALDEFNTYVQQGLQKLQMQAGQGARRQTGYGSPQNSGVIQWNDPNW